MYSHDGLQTALPHLKERWIDPEVIDDKTGEVKKLSELGGFFDEFIASVERFQQRDFVITYAMKKDVAEDIVKTVNEARERWKEAMGLPRIIDESDYKTFIRNIGSRALGAVFPLKIIHPNVFS
jgi:hypothetical protein